MGLDWAGSDWYDHVEREPAPAAPYSLRPQNVVVMSIENQNLETPVPKGKDFFLSAQVV